MYMGSAAQPQEFLILLAQYRAAIVAQFFKLCRTEPVYGRFEKSSYILA
jgi:hypothetical protein